MRIPGVPFPAGAASTSARTVRGNHAAAGRRFAGPFASSEAASVDFAEASKRSMRTCVEKPVRSRLGLVACELRTRPPMQVGAGRLGASVVPPDAANPNAKVRSVDVSDANSGGCDLTTAGIPCPSSAVRPIIDASAFSDWQCPSLAIRYLRRWGVLHRRSAMVLPN